MSLYRGAVHVEPPVADEVLLIEQGAVGTEEAVLGQLVVEGEVGAHVEGLAVGLRVSVVALDSAVTQEAGLRRKGEDGIILARGTRDGLPQGLQGVQLLLLAFSAGSHYIPDLILSLLSA